MARTKDELAKLLGFKTVEPIRRYEHRGMPCSGPPYDPEPCRVWIAANIERRQISTDEGEVALRRRRDLWQIRKLREEALAKRLRNQQLRGELVQLDAVQQWASSRLLRVRQRLELFPDELQILAPQEIRPQFRSDLQKAVRNLLLEMSEWKFE